MNASHFKRGYCILTAENKKTKQKINTVVSESTKELKEINESDYIL